MDASPGNNNLPLGSESMSGKVPGAPPPPAEVKVRTMRGDLESMARSGGGMPHFQNMKVSGLALGREESSAAPSKKNSLVAIGLVAGLIVVLAIVGYFAYSAFFGPSGGPSSTGGTQRIQHTAVPVTPLAPPTTSPVPTTTPTSSPVSAAGHASFFKKAVDETIVVTFPAPGSIKTAADLQGYGQRMLAALTPVNKAASFVEVDAKSSDGHDLSITELLAAAGASDVINPQLLAAHFNPDATFFVSRDAAGSWPGYVIALKPGENWLFLKGDVSKLEASKSIPLLFLKDIGAESPDGFSDGTVGSTTIRTLGFTGSPSARFVYGWTGSYLILSTSQAGFVQAMQRL